MKPVDLNQENKKTKDNIFLAKTTDEYLKSDKFYNIAVKDNIAVKEFKLTCGSEILKDHRPVFDATVIKRIKNYGHKIIGKTNMDEFALGSSGENSAFGNVSNPLSPEYVPGGSSSGSAAAAAMDLCDVALGSDTGGSVRQPAAFCGIYGFKPSYGALSRFGLVSFASSMDQIGLISKDINKLSTLFRHIIGKDEKDESSVDSAFFNNKMKNDPKICSFLPSNNFVSNEIRESFESFLVNSGFKADEVAFDLFNYWLSVYLLISTSELSSNLSKFTNLIYGNKERHLENWEEFRKTRTELFGKEVKRRIMLGTFVLSRKSFEKYYMNAVKARKKIFLEFNDLFREYDILIMPSTPALPFKFEELKNDPLKMYYSDCMTAGANLAGLPSISVPLKEKSGSFYPGVQFISRKYNDLELLDFVGKNQNLFRKF